MTKASHIKVPLLKYIQQKLHSLDFSITRQKDLKVLFTYFFIMEFLCYAACNLL